jgi:hypothetical protein
VSISVLFRRAPSPEASLLGFFRSADGLLHSIRQVTSSFAGLTPADDSGTDAYRRFGYQAHVAFPFCLDCYFDQNVLAVYAEHFEDVLVEYADRLRFTQIKTRNPDRGPWRYRDLLVGGGALRGLLRTHRSLNGFDDGRRIEFDIRLEGALDRRDTNIQRLTTDGSGPTEEMRRLCADQLGIDEAEAQALLERVTVYPNQPPRSLIEARNRESLRVLAGHLSANELKEVYDAAITLLKRAMGAGLFEDSWPLAVLEPDTAEEQARQLAAAKRVDRAVLAPILSRLEGGDHRLLTTISDPDRLRATDLERKLVAGRAPETLIKRAKQFRAQAAIRIAEVRVGTLYDPEQIIADLHIRLENVAQTVEEANTSDPPAPAIFARLEERLHATPAAYDPQRLLGQDPILLLGQICQLSDECRFEWGAHA